MRWQLTFAAGRDRGRTLSGPWLLCSLRVGRRTAIARRRWTPWDPLNFVLKIDAEEQGRRNKSNIEIFILALPTAALVGGRGLTAVENGSVFDLLVRASKLRPWA